MAEKLVFVWKSGAFAVGPALPKRQIGGPDCCRQLPVEFFDESTDSRPPPHACARAREESRDITSCSVELRCFPRQRRHGGKHYSLDADDKKIVGVALAHTCANGTSGLSSGGGR